MSNGQLELNKLESALEKERLAIEQERLAIEKERLAIEQERLAIDKERSAIETSYASKLTVSGAFATQATQSYTKPNELETLHAQLASEDKVIYVMDPDIVRYMLPNVKKLDVLLSQVEATRLGFYK